MHIPSKKSAYIEARFTQIKPMVFNYIQEGLVKHVIAYLIK